MRPPSWRLIAVVPMLACAWTAHAADSCGQPMADAVATVPVPGTPFEPIVTHDGCWVFVSLNSPDPGHVSGVAVFRRGEGHVTLVRVVPVESSPAGMVLTHDGHTLIVADEDFVVFLDTARMISGQGDPMLGYFSDYSDSLKAPPGSVYVNVTSDDRTLFVSDEQAQEITVVDLDKACHDGYKADAIVGRIPVGRAPIALTLSPDEKRMYTTSQVAPAAAGFTVECPREGLPDKTPATPSGAILVVDVARARTDPAHAVVSTAAAGCHPVRLVLSPKGDVAYVTARASNAVLAFDTAKLVADPAHARIASVPVGVAPVGIAVVDEGRKLVVTNSNRFGSDIEAHQSLSVIDTARMQEGAAAVLGTVPAGGFPRELRVTEDGRTLLLTNYSSQSLELIDLARLHPETSSKAESTSAR
jgi:DNA-binding beta-propeller fold protein YncE